jgi:hypothetical protein
LDEVSNCNAFQLLVTYSLNVFLRALLGSDAGVQMFCIALWFLVFQIVHTVVAMRILALSASLFLFSFSGSSSIAKPPIPLMSPIDISGHLALVVRLHIVFAVFHASFCPLNLQSSQRWCSSSSISRSPSACWSMGSTGSGRR